MMFTAEDHDKLLLAQDLLHWASQLVNDVMENHPHDMTMQLTHFLKGAKRDADNADQEVGMADRYLQLREDEAS